MVPYLERYLRERSAYLREHSVDQSMPMFPNLYQGLDGFYSANAFYIIKHDVELASGVDFKLKDFRSTLTSITVNGDMSLLPAMSAQLRHKTVGQTQKSYYRMEQGAAGRQLKNAWKNGPAVIATQKPVIDSKYEPSGYN
jgi:integrase